VVAADLSAVVINLADRPQRLRAFQQRWDAAGAPVPLRRQDAVRGGSDAACTASHLAALSAGSGPLVVFEDDACFAPTFTLDLSPPAGWDVLWLGGQHYLPPAPLDEVWARPRHQLRTHAYIARDPQALAAVIRAARVPRMAPYVAQLPLKQFVLRVHTVGQCAGTSDISGDVRIVDQFWNSSMNSPFWRAISRKYCRYVGNSG